MKNCIRLALSISVAAFASFGAATFAADTEISKGTPNGARIESFRLTLTDHQGKEWAIEDFRDKTC